MCLIHKRDGLTKGNTRAVWVWTEKVGPHLLLSTAAFFLLWDTLFYCGWWLGISGLNVGPARTENPSDPTRQCLLFGIANGGFLPHANHRSQSTMQIL